MCCFAGCVVVLCWCAADVLCWFGVLLLCCVIVVVCWWLFVNV